MAVVEERVDRQELDRRDAERLDVVDDLLRAEPGVGAAQVLVDRGMQLGEAFDVGFVDDRVVPGDAAPVGLAAPVEIRIDDRRIWARTARCRARRM